MTYPNKIRQPLHVADCRADVLRVLKMERGPRHIIIPRVPQYPFLFLELLVAATWHAARPQLDQIGNGQPNSLLPIQYTRKGYKLRIEVDQLNT